MDHSQQEEETIEEAKDAPHGSKQADRFPGRFSLITKFIFCVLAVFIADLLFFDVSAGWTTGLFSIFLAGLIVSSHGQLPEDAIDWGGRCWVVCMSISLVVSVNPLTMILAGASLLSLYSIRRITHQTHAFSFLRSTVRDLGQIVASPILDTFSILESGDRVRSDQRGSVSRWFFDWVFPSVLLLTFVFLFSLANPIISHVFVPFRILFWVFVGTLVWGLIRLPRSYSFFPTRDQMDFTTSLDFPDISPGAVTRSLLAFNLLFLLQNGLDIMYLWGGRRLPEGMNYAEYAHRGSYPLVATALLAAVFVLVSFRENEKPEQMKWARRLVYLWIVQNIFLLCSAAWRLWIYVDFYGLSRWRIATAIWMILVATGFVYIAIRIVGGLSNRWLINANAFTAIVLLSLCSFVNMDRFIAEYNVAHCREVNGDGASIDIRYLKRLGPDAIPALQKLRPHLPERRQREKTSKMIKTFSEQLVEVTEDWRGFTYRRANLLQEVIGRASRSKK